MRELQYAILGLVNRGPMTGYDITKHFQGTLSKFWEAKHSQIYPELRRLVDEGLVEYQIAIQGERMEKKLYTITAAGRRSLMDWLRLDEPLGSVPKEAFRLRLYFGESLQKEELAALIKSQYRMHAARLALLRAAKPMHQAPPEVGSEAFGDYLLILGGLYREEACMEWLRSCAGLLGVTLDEEQE